MGRSGVRKVSGKFKAELDALTLYNLFRNRTPTAISAIWTGGIAGGANPYQLTISCPNVIFQGNTPKVSGLGPVDIELPFESYYNGSTDEFQVILQNLVTAVP
jgi:hypothetical protein